MNDETTSLRRLRGAGEQSRGMPADGGAIEIELRNADGGVRIEVLVLEVVGVPVRRAAVGDEWEWCLDRARRLRLLAVELRVAGCWGLYRSLLVRAMRVMTLAEALWRRRCESWAMRDAGAGRMCRSLVLVVNEGRAGR